ncbi:hypothetical protein JHK85_012928 [Glycine max]|nr:hypothetical protein JHK87_012487 [Glycine soja]KAG5040452.1 hypothetical protein JHK85_012928 [Glycine max]
MNGKVLNGRTLAASITTDNGHVPEFIRKCVYCDTNKVVARGVKPGLAWRVGPADDDDLFDEDSIVKTTSSKGASNVVDVD